VDKGGPGLPDSRSFRRVELNSHSSLRLGFGELLFGVFDDVGILDIVAFIEDVFVVLLERFGLLVHDVAAFNKGKTHEPTAFLQIIVAGVAHVGAEDFS